jgi:hypothetical protein
MHHDSFGVLRHPVVIAFDGGEIRPLKDHSSIVAQVDEGINPDGFYYPPPQVTVSETRRGEEEVPRSKRCALVYSLPPTHTIRLDSPVQSDFRRGDGGFLIHLAAYVFGTRLQFSDWWVEGRIPIRQRTHAVEVTTSKATAFFSAAYATWRTWNDTTKKNFTGAIYLHSKAPGYEWTWEQFLMEYLVLDSLWRHADDVHRLGRAKTKVKHHERIERLCTHFALWYDNGVAGEIVGLRNELFHEAIWEGDTPGFAVSYRGHHLCNCLRALNQRLIAAAAGFKGPYSGSSWADWTQTRFFE